jgi:hypothetical protein
LIIVIISLPLEFINNTFKQIIVTFATGVLLLIEKKHVILKVILENKLFIFLGRISFSIYMWHQLVLAYTRYAWIEEPTAIHYTLMGLFIVFLSVLSYQFIEQPFRNKKLVSNKFVYLSTFIFFVVTTIISVYIYMNAGVVRDVPELGIEKSNVSRNMHGVYNDRVYTYKAKFESEISKKNILIIGNSFTRDWGNVLLESEFGDSINIYYEYNFMLSKLSIDEELLNKADIIFVSTSSNKEELLALTIFNEVHLKKIFNIGKKNFGVNNGIF